ncbi:Uncharacterised protein [Klebsiella pneumoniae]|nr:Uncharacterised protein [Klebsiella pneumoniae]
MSPYDIVSNKKSDLKSDFLYQWHYMCRIMLLHVS